LKLRLRSRTKPDNNSMSGSDHLAPRKKIVKRAPPRGLNKRRRSEDDDMGRDDVDEDEIETFAPALLDAPFLFSPIAEEEPQQLQEEESSLPPCPHTPKRARIAPEALPLGLERSDFHELHLSEGGAAGDERTSGIEGTDVRVEADGEAWSAEDDRVLVELVLEKLKLTKTEWQDCARSLGKDRHSVGRRWKSLMVNGEIGLKTRSSSRRSKIHGTWR
jgi:hypothetical protein